VIFSHHHKYEAIATEHSSPGPFMPASTVILWRCRCNDARTTRIDGKWELSQVRGERELTLAEASEEMLPR
jgi:hypothetical protein